MKYTPQEQSAHVELWRESGMSKAAYCREANLRYHVFNTWVRKHQPPDKVDESSAGMAFVELTRPTAQRAPGIAAEFDPSLNRWYIHASANAEWVGHLFRALSQC